MSNLLCYKVLAKENSHYGLCVAAFIVVNMYIFGRPCYHSLDITLARIVIDPHPSAQYSTVKEVQISLLIYLKHRHISCGK